ncbi:glycosyltransferase family 2 protein [Actinotalea ferrariae]|uniref:glycosyltransferase family 2 protein n=1 Tax=Actinotalea ferrariae TaxID=1386098 RepID=UPI001C8C7634|nr:glycosyltransferase family 2 protein [Actinotalea ferrariae]MBX9246636.1 glycosyltransferase family 2 protein [Actinotalea ferrariae]
MTTSTASISAVLIVRDEQDVLEACLTSLAWVDEIVVYDTGSSDRTLEIARRLAHTVVEGYWDHDFAAARNRAMAYATGEWVLSVDADEVFEGDAHAVRRHLGRHGAPLHSVIVDSSTGAAHLPLAGLDQSSHLATPRLFRRTAHVWRGQIHEEPMPVIAGAERVISPLPGAVLRHSGYAGSAEEVRTKGERNLEIARAHLARGISEGAEPADLELRRIHVVRSCVMAGHLDEALELADAMRDDGFLVERHAVVVAPAIVGVAEVLQGPEAARRWFTVWEAHDLNPAAARLARAKFEARRGDPAAALEAVEGIPTVTVNALGERFERAEVVKIEVWALARLGRGRRAVQVAAAAASRGTAPGSPAGLAELLGETRCRAVIGSLTEELWRESVTAALMDPSPHARTFLMWMHDVRPGDATVLAAVAMAAPTLSLEEATKWSVAMRRAGAAVHCPLISIADDSHVDPRQRALAGALAYSVYGDDRGLRGLEAALATVPADAEAELLAHLEVVAPGLVTPAVG